VTRLPSLGSRGEGWVLVQGLPVLALAAAGILAGGAWDGELAIITTLSGAFLLASGLALRFWSRHRLGRSHTWMPRPLKDAALVETGVYALVRHPLYGGMVVAASGWALLTASPLALLLTAGLGVASDFKARREEVWLLRQYAGYADYMERTRRLIPWIY